MQLTATILSSVAALAGTAAAQAPHAALNFRFPVPTAPPQPLAVRNMLQARRTGFEIPASLTECHNSMMAAMSAIPTPAPELASWASDNMMDAFEGGVCLATMPESLSSDYHGYTSKLVSWAVGMSSTLDQVKAKCTEARGEDQPMVLAVSCTANPTILWVNAEGKTRAEEQTLPTQLVAGGGGAGKGAASTGSQAPASSTAGSGSAAATGSASGTAPAKASGTSPAAASAGSALRSAGLGMLVGAVAFAAVLM